MGIAQSQRLSAKGSYIAGLWEKDLVYGLLWKSRKWNSTIGYTEPHRHKPAENYMALSWSCVSLLNSTIIFEPIHASRNLPRASVTVEVESQTQIDSSDAVDADSEDADDRENDEGDVRLENYGLPLLRCRPGSYELPLQRILEAETTLTGSSAYGAGQQWKTKSVRCNWTTYLLCRDGISTTNQIPGLLTSSNWSHRL
jgi:hypothetical protein